MVRCGDWVFKGQASIPVLVKREGDVSLKCYCKNSLSTVFHGPQNKSLTVGEFQSREEGSGDHSTLRGLKSFLCISIVMTVQVFWKVPPDFQSHKARVGHSRRQPARHNTLQLLIPVVTYKHFNGSLPFPFALIAQFWRAKIAPPTLVSSQVGTALDETLDIWAKGP